MGPSEVSTSAAINANRNGWSTKPEYANGIHQRVRQDFGMSLLADARQQLLAVRGCRPSPA